MDGLLKVLVELLTPAAGTLLAAVVSGWAERRKLARGGHMNG